MVDDDVTSLREKLKAADKELEMQKLELDVFTNRALKDYNKIKNLEKDLKAADPARLAAVEAMVKTTEAKLGITGEKLRQANDYIVNLEGRVEERDEQWREMKDKMQYMQRELDASEPIRLSFLEALPREVMSETMLMIADGIRGRIEERKKADEEWRREEAVNNGQPSDADWAEIGGLTIEGSGKIPPALLAGTEGAPKSKKARILKARWAKLQDAVPGSVGAKRKTDSMK